MFQRLKGAIDSRIAEEQARQKSTAASGPPARSSSTVKRTNSRTESPATKPRRPRPKDDGTSVRGPDPAEFENAFVVEDEPEELPKAETPAIPEEKGAAMAEDDATAAASGSGEGGVRNGNISPNPIELPAEVRTKLRKLEKLESKYQELLRSYRVAHAKAVSVEPFEKALRENTPLVSITDPDAFLEYINQINSKGDMVMDEYRRVSSERNDYKKKFEDADKEATIAQEELVALKRSIAGDGATEKTDTMSMDTPTASVKSPVSSVLGIFSPKQKAESADCQDVGEEFFSYDDEVPKLQSEVQQRTDEVEKLKSKVCALENDLATAEESRSALVMDLEKATQDLEKSKNPATEGQPQTRVLTDKLQATELQLSTLKADLAKQKTEAEEKVTILEGYIANHKENANRSLKSETQSRKEAEETRQKLEEQIKELEDVRIRNTKRLVELSKEVKSLTKQVEEKEAEDTKRLPTPTTLEVPAITAGGATSAAKKKNKKKKKGGNGAFNASGSTANDGAANTTSDFVSGAPISMDLQAEVERLKEEVANRDNQISKLQTKRMTEADLREELENMQDNFLQVGQEHVEAKDKIKQLQQEKIALEEKIEKLESEIDTYKNKSKDSEKMEVDFKTLAAEFEDLKIKSASLQSDLEHSEKLASTRFKDLSDLREVLQKAQPELKTLRTEHANMKATKDELAARTSDLRRLEAREKDLKSDIGSFKKQAADSQVEIRTLNEKVIHETNSRLRAEDQNRVAQRDMRKSEAEKIQLAASGEKSAAELAKVQEDAGKLRTKVRELEAQLSKLTSEANGLREEVELRGSQYNNAQGLLGSMRDQAGEMAMQLKEAKDQSESLEQELGEIQRLLSERTREGETMRRLLADVDDRADAKVREMRERMETAIEERDRAEDEASTNGRKRAREAEELKGKIRDVEKELKRATDEREDLLRAEKEWKRKRDELESTADHATKEAGEIRSVMSELRDALDGSEKQIRSAENQRAESRRLLDEANQRYEKLQKEFKMLQAKQTKLSETSSRSSTDSRPVSVNGNAPAASGAKMDYVYLKTILLQFLEQRDKKRQADLVKTVLGQLLQFDKKDQDRWIAAISAK